jgi:hypothetical protein
MTATTPSAAGATTATRTVRCSGLDAGTVVAGAAAADATAAIATAVVTDGAHANHTLTAGSMHGPTNPPATASAAFMGQTAAVIGHVTAPAPTTNQCPDNASQARRRCCRNTSGNK